MQCRVRSADRTHFDGQATMVVARSTRGEFAVMDGHAPLLSAIRSGPLRIKTPDGERVFACFGGTLRVAEDATVTVLVEDAIAVEEIQPETIAAQPEPRRAILASVKETYA